MLKEKPSSDHPPPPPKKKKRKKKAGYQIGPSPMYVGANQRRTSSKIVWHLKLDV